MKKPFALAIAILIGSYSTALPTSVVADSTPPVTVSGTAAIDNGTQGDINVCFYGANSTFCTVASNDGTYSMSLPTVYPNGPGPVTYDVDLEGSAGTFTFKSNPLQFVLDASNPNVILNLTLQTQQVQSTYIDQLGDPVSGGTEVASLDNGTNPTDGTYQQLNYSSSLSLTPQNYNGWASSSDTQVSDPSGKATFTTLTHFPITAQASPPPGSDALVSEYIPSGVVTSDQPVTMIMVYPGIQSTSPSQYATTNAPVISWDPVDGATKYVIARIHQEGTTGMPIILGNGSYALNFEGAVIATQTGTTYTDQPNLPEGAYAYGIFAYDDQGDIIASTGLQDAISVDVDRTPPSITNTSLTPNPVSPSGKVVVKATIVDAAPGPGISPTGIDIAEYYIGSDPGVGQATPLTWTAVDSNTSAMTGQGIITAPTTPGTYPVVIRAVDYAENVATTTLNLVVSLAVPMGLSATTPTNNAPTLTWNAVPIATSYEILRQGATASTGFALVGTSTTAKFTDTYTPGVYNYEVVALGPNGAQSAPSDPFQVAVTNTNTANYRNLMAQGQTQVLPVVGTDILPGLTTDNTVAASFDFDLGYRGRTFTITRPLTFTFNAGGHHLYVQSSSADWMVVSGANNSQGSFQGLATVTLDSVTTKALPYTVIATDGSLTNPTSPGYLNLTVYTNTTKTTVLYSVNAALIQGKIKIN